MDFREKAHGVLCLRGGPHDRRHHVAHAKVVLFRRRPVPDQGQRLEVLPIGFLDVGVIDGEPKPFAHHPYAEVGVVGPNRVRKALHEIGIEPVVYRFEGSALRQGMAYVVVVVMVLLIMRLIF